MITTNETFIVQQNIVMGSPTQWVYHLIGGIIILQ